MVNSPHCLIDNEFSIFVNVILCINYVCDFHTDELPYTGRFEQGVGQDHMSLDVYSTTSSDSYFEFSVTATDCAYLGIRQYFEMNGKKATNR